MTAKELIREKNTEKTKNKHGRMRFPLITSLPVDRPKYNTSASDLDGTLVVTDHSFENFMLLSRKVGSVFRTALLCLLAPVMYITYHLISESAGSKMLIYVSLAGLKEEDVRRVSRDMLTSKYAAHVRRDSWELFTEGTGKRVVVTASPSVIVEDFVKQYLGADCIGTQLVVNSKTGKFTGQVEGDVLLGSKKREMVRQAFGTSCPDLGLGDRDTDHDFMEFCQQAFMVPNDKHAPIVSEAEQLARIARGRSRNLANN